MADTILNYILYFFFYSNIGWFFESIYCSIAARKWINRGFLTGPICPIYGAGALVLHICLSPIADKWYLVFLLGMVLCDIVEFITSLILEKLFHARWWDYSEKFLNLQGRICFQHTLIWGGAAIIMVGRVLPFFNNGINMIPTLYRKILVIIILTAFAVDLSGAVIAAADIRNFNKRLREFGNLFINAAGSVTRWTGELSAQLVEIKAQFDAIRRGEGSKKKAKTARMFRASKELHNFPTNTFERIEEVVDELKKRITDEETEML